MYVAYSKEKSTFKAQDFTKIELNDMLEHIKTNHSRMRKELEDYKKHLGSIISEANNKKNDYVDNIEKLKKEHSVEIIDFREKSLISIKEHLKKTDSLISQTNERILSFEKFHKESINLKESGILKKDGIVFGEDFTFYSLLQ